MRPKSIWIKAELKGIRFSHSKSAPFSLFAECFHVPTENLISSNPCLLAHAATCLCFAEGIINSSGNALVKTMDNDYLPVGKITKDFKIEHGVCVFSLQNDISRETPPEYVKSREDAEKLCLLAQTFPEGWTVSELAIMSGIDTARLDLKNVRLFARFAEAASVAARNSLDIPQISVSSFRAFRN